MHEHLGIADAEERQNGATVSCARLRFVQEKRAADALSALFPEESGVNLAALAMIQADGDG